MSNEKRRWVEGIEAPVGTRLPVATGVVEYQPLTRVRGLPVFPDRPRRYSGAFFSASKGKRSAGAKQ